MGVVIFHCMISFNIFFAANYYSEYENNFVKIITESPLKILWSGTEPVLLFFVLSGFVLSLSFLKGKSVNYKIFLMKRFTRIYIPYIVVMAISVVLVLVFVDIKNIGGMSNAFDNRWEHEVTFKAILAYIFMINYDTANVNGVVWTLYHEMRISIIFPFLMILILKWDAIKSLLVSGLIILGSWLVLLLVSSKTAGMITLVLGDFRETVFYITFFVFGAILAKYRVEVSMFITKKKPFIKTLLFILSIVMISARWIINVVPFLPYNVHEIVVGLGITLLFAVVLSSRLAQKILMNKSLLWLGKISYSLYLVHIIVLMLLAILLGNVIGIGLAIAITPIISLPAAWLVYRYVEVPSIKLGAKWSETLKQRFRSKTKKATAVNEP